MSADPAAPVALHVVPDLEAVEDDTAGLAVRHYTVTAKDGTELRAWTHLDASRINRIERMAVFGDAGGELEFSAWDSGLDALAWVRKAAELGVGEVLLNSMDADGTTDGFDLELISAVRREVGVPVIASGGAGSAADFPPAVEAGADAVLAATVFHFGTVTIAEAKAALAAAGHPVR